VKTGASSSPTAARGRWWSGPFRRERTAHGSGPEAASAVSPDPPEAKVDLAPDLFFGDLLIDDGSPMITTANTVLVPTRVSNPARPWRSRGQGAVQTILSPGHYPGAPAGERYEWCINPAVVDLADHSVMVNSEDGTLYRWDLARNTLAEQIHLNRPRGEAYTPTLIGPDGTVSINNATLYAVGR
jgi:hypothetical protein